MQTASYSAPSSVSTPVPVPFFSVVCLIFHEPCMARALIMDFRGNEVNTLIICDQLLTTELPDGRPQRATIIKPITIYESNSYQEGNDYNKGGDKLAGF